MSPLNNHRVYLSLGSNLGNSFAILQQALILLQELPVQKFSCSQVYETTPVSSISQPNFLNAVCSFETALSVSELFTRIQMIEKKLGKVPKPREAPRLIDLDILFYGEENYADLQLKIPHPRWLERLFVLVPLSELTTKIKINHQGVSKEWILKDCISSIKNQSVRLFR